MTIAYYGYLALGGALSLVGLVISQQLKAKFGKYSQFPTSSGLSGRDIAQTMLRDHGINDVQIVESQGMLSDHYNPLTRTVALSPEVFHGRSVASAAVAAHECGHAVQHATAYRMLQLRSRLVPVVQFSAMAQQWLLLIAFLTLNTMPQIMLATIAAFALTTAFSFITLPVEFDASRRALVWLDRSGITRGTEHEGAKDALKWAALTYVSAALSALVMLLFLIFRYIGSRED